MSGGPAPVRRSNRFERHRKKTLLVVIVVLLGLVELASYAILRVKGHAERRGRYPYNRILSGYTVVKNTPNFDVGTSTIKTSDGQPSAKLDAHGFLSDGPVVMPKPAGAIRIFVVGGSMALGAGQNSRYHAAHDYPDGVFTYELSIAGQLKKFLSEKRPDATFEVITAATYERRFHQSLIAYLETISQFDPDVIVNVDGMNDVGSIATGEPYRDAEEALEQYAEMYVERESWLNTSNTYHLVSTAIDKFRVSQARAAPAISAKQPTGVERDQAYAARKPRFVENSGRFLQIVDHYLAVLKADGVRPVIVLQPLLNRADANKQLSEIEKKLAAVQAPFATTSTAAVDDNLLVLERFFGDYLSAKLREHVIEQGGVYVDMNAEIAPLGPEVEFYTDYCHLTAEGNRILAETVGEQILEAGELRGQ
jgi:lysophospholipase L1-like esterase